MDFQGQRRPASPGRRAPASLRIRTFSRFLFFFLFASSENYPNLDFFFIIMYLFLWFFFFFFKVILS